MRKHEAPEENKEQRIQQYQSADDNEKLIFNLRDISHTMRFLYEGKGSQGRVLIVLGKTGTITQQELTEKLGIRPGSASEVFAKLESAGLISRTPSETDRRTANIALTEKGQEFSDRAAEQRRNRHEQMFSCLTQEEKTQLLVLLEKINADWEQRYHEEKDRKEPPEHPHFGHHGSFGHHGGHLHDDHRGGPHGGKKRKGEPRGEESRTE